MQISRIHSQSSPHCAAGTALTIGNFDGVHLGHQAMLAQLQRQASERGLQTCALTFEPHPRDYFASATQRPDIAPARILTLRDKLRKLAATRLNACALLPFNRVTAQLPAEAFIEDLLVKRLRVRYLLVGDDFRFGAQRRGDLDMLRQAGARLGFEVEQMSTVSQQGQRVSSSLVREALQRGAMVEAAQLLGEPYTVSGHVVHGRRLGRELGFRTLNQRFQHWKPACSGIFAVQVHGLLDGHPLAGVANLGIRPSLEANDVNGGRVLLETHVLQWPAPLGLDAGYGKIIRVELLHKLHDELRYDSLSDLTAGINKDCDDARAFFQADYAQTLRQTTRDRI